MFLIRNLGARLAVVALVVLCATTVGCDKVQPSGVLTLTSVSPATGPSGGGGELLITGTGFVSGATVTLGTMAAEVTSVSPTFLRAVAPAHAPGTVDVVVTNPRGENVRLPGVYAYLPLAASEVSPATGLIGDVVKLSGTGFMSGATVTVGGVTAKITGRSVTAIVFITPVHDPESVDVVVINPNGERATLPGGFTYQVITVTASPGLAASGDQLTVSWSAPGSRPTSGGGDWIVIHRVGDPDNVFGNWFDHLQGASSGTLTLKAPVQPGRYEFLYMVESTAVARSNPVTVNAGG